MTVNRPGIYSSYSVSSLYPQGRGGQAAAVVMVDSTLEPATLYTVENMAQLAQLGCNEVYTKMVEILLLFGVAKVYCVAAEADTPQAYAAAMEAIAEVQGIGVVVCGSQNSEVLAQVEYAVKESSAALRERIAVAGVLPNSAVLAAAGLNSERMLLCTPALEFKNTLSVQNTAAAMAAVLLQMGDPGENLNGKELPQDVSIPAALSEEQIEACLAGGVTPLEEVGGTIEVVRAVTTRTSTDGAADKTFLGVNTILIIDYVVSSLRQMLHQRLKGARNNGITQQSIASQTAIALAGYCDMGILDSYATPKVTQSASDPEVCMVEVAFTVASVLSQIHLAVHITV